MRYTILIFDNLSRKNHYLCKIKIDSHVVIKSYFSNYFSSLIGL